MRTIKKEKCRIGMSGDRHLRPGIECGVGKSIASWSELKRTGSIVQAE